MFILNERKLSLIGLGTFNVLIKGALVNTGVLGLFGESGRKLSLRVDSLLRDG